MRAADREVKRRLRILDYNKPFRRRIVAENRDFGSTKRLGYSTPLETVDLGGRLELTSDPDSVRQLMRIAELPVTVPGTRVRILLNEVEGIDAPAVLFLCSRIRRLARMNARISGTYPNDAGARQTLADADFDGFVSGTRRLNAQPTAGQQLQLIEGNFEGDIIEVDPDVSVQIQEFLQKRNPTLVAVEADHLSLAVAECLENVGSHAYGERWPWTRGPKAWFVVGLYNEATKTTSVAILDTGVGIVKSVTTNMSRLGKLFSADADLLEDATLGILTQSTDPKHGKGLRSLREFAVTSPGRSFHVMSSGRMITWRKDCSPIKRSLPKFDGTIVCLEIQETAGASP